MTPQSNFEPITEMSGSAQSAPSSIRSRELPSSRAWLYGLASLVCIVASVVLMIRLMRPGSAPVPPTDALAAARSAYQRGEQALEANRAADALAAFQAARAALDQVQVVKDPPTLAEALYLRYRMTRDQQHAHALAHGKPIPERIDSLTGERYRGLPLGDEKLAYSALTDLYRAAELAPRDPHIPAIALREFVSLPNPSWDVVEYLAKAVVSTAPNDSRANYFLARIHFLQPHTGTGKIPDPEQRHSDRVDQALRYLNAAKQARMVPLWRTLALEIAIHDWQAKYGAVRRNNPALQAQSAEMVQRLLFDSQNGAIAQAQRGNGLVHMSMLDVEGLVQTLQLAAEIRAAEGHHPPDAGTKLIPILHAARAVLVAANEPSARQMLAQTMPQFTKAFQTIRNQAGGSLGADADRAFAELELTLKNYP